MPLPYLSPGAIVDGKYRLAERLGGGGMGDVYRAEHQLAGRWVALKVLRADRARDTAHAKRFFHEAKAVNRIRHPNIVDVLDAGVSEYGPYVAMEYLDGVSLGRALEREGRLTPETALSVIAPVLSALDEAHRQGIIHRDIKPENVFLARIGQDVIVKVLDFGIAKMADPTDDAPHTSTGTVFGTPDYLSPEQARGEFDLDGRSDVFSVGVVLYELLSGRRPFEAASAIALAYRIVHQRQPDLRTHLPEIEPNLEHAIEVALEKREEERYFTAGAFLERLAPHIPDGTERRDALRRLLLHALGETPPMGDDRPSGPPLLPFSAAAPSPLPPRKLPAPSMPVTLQSQVVPPHPRVPTLDDRTGTGLAGASVAPGPPSVHGEPPSTYGRPRDRSAAPPMPAPKPREVMSSSAMRAASRATGQTVRPTDRPSSSQLPWTTRGPRSSENLRVASSARGGQCRGALVHAVVGWVVHAFDESTHLDLARRAHCSSDGFFRGEPIHSILWYPFDELERYTDLVTDDLLHGNAERWRDLARSHADRDLAAVICPATTSVTLDVALVRAIPRWGKLLDFGVPTACIDRDGRALVRFDEFELAKAPLRHMVIGSTEAILSTLGAKHVAARPHLGEASHARRLEFYVTWD